MEVRLRVASGRNAGQVLSVSMPRFFIGRAEDCHLRPHSDMVSRHHCVLLFESDSVLVRDLGSKNGTFVNSRRVQPEVELNNGDRLQVGQLDFEVQIHSEIGAKKQPAVHSVQEAMQRTTTVIGPKREEDLDFDIWFSESQGTTAPEPPETRNDQAEEIGVQADDRPRQEASKPGAPVAKGPEAKPVSADPGTQGPAPRHKRPVSTNTRDAAGEALKQFLRGR